MNTQMLKYLQNIKGSKDANLAPSNMELRYATQGVGRSVDDLERENSWEEGASFMLESFSELLVL